MERDISTPSSFETWEAAHNEMCSRIAEVLDEPVEDIKESYLSGEEYDDDTCVLENSAWTERHHNNYDWKIFQCEEEE